MRKILPVNKSPYFKAYAHLGYQHIIESSNDKVVRNDEEVAILNVRDFKLEEWNINNKKLRYKIDDKTIKFYTNKWNIGMDAIFSRNCETNDCIEINIEKQLFSNPYANIKIFISELSCDDFSNAKDFSLVDPIYNLGCFSKDGIYCSKEKYIVTSLYSNNEFPITLKMVKDNNKVFIKYETGSFKSELQLLKEFNAEISVKTIGFAIFLGNNYYYEDIFSNYVNIEFCKYNYLALDFIYSPIKNYHTHSYNYFTDTNIYTENEIQVLGFSLIDFVKKQIDIKRYIETMINDNIYYKEFNKTFFHSDLIYGYDDEEKFFYTLFYYNGYIKEGHLLYSDFISEYNKYDKREIFSIKYNPGYEGISFSKESILNKFIEYRDSISISQPHYRYKFLNSTTGQKCLECLSTYSNLEYVKDDIRITYTLLERAICNRDRIEYLLMRNIISSADSEILSVIADESVKKLQVLKNLILKMRMNNVYDIEKLQNYILEICDLDKKYTNKIISILAADN